jgi:hypothetical protein
MRPTFDEVTRGLETKSEMIVELAKVGYLPAEIGSLLSIRYQHVRKVLDRSLAKGVVQAGHQDGSVSKTVANVR